MGEVSGLDIPKGLVLFRVEIVKQVTWTERWLWSEGRKHDLIRGGKIWSLTVMEINKSRD